MDTEFVSWTKITLTVVFLIVGAFVYRDYHSSPEEWRGGRVTDKVDRQNPRRNLCGYCSSYFIYVESGKSKGTVSVSYWTYKDWHVGDACEIASRHGHILNYDFTDLRRPQNAER
jgi:hypothetical protein